jgi:hypothetical protein
MTVRQISIISFIGLVALLLAGPGVITHGTHLFLTCTLLVILTSATIVDFLIISQRKEIGDKALVLTSVLGLLMGCVTSAILGSQRHDEYDGGPSFGRELWPFVLGVVYPICFSIFILCLGQLKNRSIQLGVLFAWIIATLVYGYYFGDSYTSFNADTKNARLFYDSVYFPSATKVVTPLLTGTVLLWTLWMVVKLKVLKTSSRQHGL